MPAAAIIDIDGTLVDTNYHHALAWHRAFRTADRLVPLWRIHRSVGMGGDQLVSALCGDEFEREHGDDVRDAEASLYGELIDEVEPFAGARELLESLRRRDCRVVLASSAKAAEVDHYVDLLDAGEVVDAWTTEADVDSTKPEPDLLGVALEKVEVAATEAVMVGDSVWDCEAARRAKIRMVGVLSGGFGEAELRGAGAIAVFDSVAELDDDLERSPLA